MSHHHEDRAPVLSALLRRLLRRPTGRTIVTYVTGWLAEGLQDALADHPHGTTP